VKICLNAGDEKATEVARRLLLYHHVLLVAGQHHLLKQNSTMPSDLPELGRRYPEWPCWQMTEPFLVIRQQRELNEILMKAFPS
jgi:hypothetical protein